MLSCFYCGSHEHSSSECVQKADIQDIPADAINQLGYCSMPRVVELFSEHKSGSINLVSAAIYELSYGFRQEYDEEMWQKDSSAGQHLLDYVINFARGFVNIESDHPEAAIPEFEDALNKSPAEVYATRAQLLKAQAQYSAGDVDAAVLTIAEGVENIQQISAKDCRTYDYQLSRYYAAKGEAETSISYLKQLIEGEEETEGDKQYFVKALIDSHFDDSREAINEYLDRLQKQRKEVAQEMMELAEASIASAKRWEIEIEDAESKLEQARQQFETESYYGYIDAQSLAQTSRDIAAAAEEKKREVLAHSASEAQQNAHEAMEPAQELLTRLGNPQKQLQIFHAQFQHFEDAKNHLAESQAAFTLDNYRGYILSVEEAQKT
ncbi:MAG: tetratricopeptide repeat protein, partial [Candidatus Poribacteria bacterium]